MIAEMKSLLSRTSGTLVQDMAGAAALVLMLFVGLNLAGGF